MWNYLPPITTEEHHSVWGLKIYKSGSNIPKKWQIIFQYGAGKCHKLAWKERKILGFCRHLKDKPWIYTIISSWGRSSVVLPHISKIANTVNNLFCGDGSMNHWYFRSTFCVRQYCLCVVSTCGFLHYLRDKAVFSFFYRNVGQHIFLCYTKLGIEKSCTFKLFPSMASMLS